MAKALPTNENFRAAHYLSRAIAKGECLCLGKGSYRPTWWKPGRKTERIATLICRVYYGQSPGQDAVVMHSCDNISCINPDHLRWGTQRSNLQDAFSKGRMSAPPSIDQTVRVRNGTHHSTRLRPADIKSIRERLAKGETLTAIAADFRISFQQVSKIKLGLRWSHVL